MDTAKMVQSILYWIDGLSLREAKQVNIAKAINTIAQDFSAIKEDSNYKGLVVEESNIQVAWEKEVRTNIFKGVKVYFPLHDGSPVIERYSYYPNRPFHLSERELISTTPYSLEELNKSLKWL